MPSCTLPRLIFAYCATVPHLQVFRLLRTVCSANADPSEVTVARTELVKKLGSKTALGEYVKTLTARSACDGSCMLASSCLLKVWRTMRFACECYDAAFYNLSTTGGIHPLTRTNAAVLCWTCSSGVPALPAASLPANYGSRNLLICFLNAVFHVPDSQRDQPEN